MMSNVEPSRPCVVPHPETRIVLCNISWATYEALVADSDSPGKRIVFDHGT